MQPCEIRPICNFACLGSVRQCGQGLSHSLSPLSLLACCKCPYMSLRISLVYLSHNLLCKRRSCARVYQRPQQVRSSLPESCDGCVLQDSAASDMPKSAVPLCKHACARFSRLGHVRFFQFCARICKDTLCARMSSFVRTLQLSIWQPLFCSTSFTTGRDVGLPWSMARARRLDNSPLVTTCFVTECVRISGLFGSGLLWCS